MAKSDNKKNNIKSGIILIVVALISSVSIGWDQGLFSSNSKAVTFGDNKSNLKVPTNLPEGAEFIRSTDPSKPSKIIQSLAPPQRVQTAKDLTMIVSDYINASEDKEAAKASLKFTMALPSITKEFKVQQQETEIARMKFEQKEWELKLSKLDDKGLDGFKSEEVNDVQTASNKQETFYSNTSSGLNSKVDKVDNIKKTSASDFSLLSVTETLEGKLVALITAGGKEYQVMDDANIDGQFKINISSLTSVSICDAGDCIPIY
jgi:hypothetical protein